jgi:hypothetical protein
VVAGVAAVFLGAAARDHRGGDVAPIWQETLPDNAAVAVDVALPAGELLPRDQGDERGRRPRAAGLVRFRGIEAQTRTRSLAELSQKVSPSTTRVTWPVNVPDPWGALSALVSGRLA